MNICARAGGPCKQDVLIFACGGASGGQGVCLFYVPARHPGKGVKGFAPEEHDVYIFTSTKAPGEQDVHILTSVFTSLFYYISSGGCSTHF